MSTPPAYYPSYEPAPAAPHGSLPVQRRGGAVLPWTASGAAVLALLLAVVPFSAGIAWLPALTAIVLGVVSLVRRSHPTWPAIVALALGPVAWTLAIVVTLVSWAIASSAELQQASPAAAPRPVSTATWEPAASVEPAAPQPAAEPSAVPVDPVAEVPVQTPEALAEAPALPGIGETVLVDDWAFTVVSVGGRTSLAGDSTWGAEAQGEFVPIVVRVENRGTASEAFWPDDVVAFDPEGRAFSYSSEASIWADDSIDWYDEINPGNVVEGAIYFDVPPGTPLERVVLDVGWFSEPAEIALQ